nr:DUF802 domain-containing protein [Zoogloeaceae bacterium]
MNTFFNIIAFVVGAAVLAWIGSGYVATSPLALAVTALIGVVYLAGAIELLRFHRATAALARALAAIPPGLTDPNEWLARLPASLQNRVRLRIEGEHVGLPGPALTPYLVGLLVLLGMLGTFLGMVVTLKGAVVALESSTDLHTIRAALAAPVKGLGVAFGTSVAGVAASAMLGLMSALCRRARLHAGQTLDARIATDLRGFSLAHQRQETYQAVQAQAAALPELVTRLEAMMTQMAHHAHESNERLLAGQARFHHDVHASFTTLAASVDASLQHSLSAGARLAGETIQPAVEATMSAIARETTALHTRVADTVGIQLDGLSARFDRTVTTVADTWSAALAEQARSNEDLSAQAHRALESVADTFAQRSAALVAEIGAAQAVLQADLAAGDQARLAGMHQALEALAVSLRTEWEQAGARALASQEQICRTLGDTARDISADAKANASSTIAEVARLMQVAAEAPRAAAEVIAELRQELSASMVRDNALLAERSRIMETLGTLLAAINHASTEQRDAIDTLVASSAAMLARAGTRFAESVEAESARLSDIAGQIGGGAVEVASLGEAFGLAVRLFSESNDKLMTTLHGIEGALGKSMTRSDEQLAYYVAQAREIIDLSIMSQKQIVEDLQQLSRKPAARADEA